MSFKLFVLSERWKNEFVVLRPFRGHLWDARG